MIFSSPKHDSLPSPSPATNFVGFFSCSSGSRSQQQSCQHIFKEYTFTGFMVSSTFYLKTNATCLILSRPLPPPPPNKNERENGDEQNPTQSIRLKIFKERGRERERETTIPCWLIFVCSCKECKTRVKH